VQIVIIYRDLSNAAKNICIIEETVGKIYGNTQDIVKTVDKLGEVQAAEKVSEKVRKSLGIDKEKENIHTSAHSGYSSTVPGTAAWLFERSDYREWADVTDNNAPHSVLSIAAPAEYGKSYLTHAVINDLNGKSQTPKQRVKTWTAWYYFPKGCKATDRALKHIIREFADADAAYLLNNCKDLRNPEGSKLRTRVFTSYNVSRPQPEVFFVILDGLDNLD
jgi:chromosomal replication initiation ATPase DnaA